MAKYTFAVLGSIFLLAVAYILFIPNKFTPSSKDNNPSPTQGNNVTSNQSLPTLTPTPDLSDSSIESDLTALERDILEIENSNNDFLGEIKGL